MTHSSKGKFAVVSMKFSLAKKKENSFEISTRADIDITLDG